MASRSEKSAEPLRNTPPPSPARISSPLPPHHKEQEIQELDPSCLTTFTSEDSPGGTAEKRDSDRFLADTLAENSCSGGTAEKQYIDKSLLVTAADKVDFTRTTATQSSAQVAKAFRDEIAELWAENNIDRAIDVKVNYRSNGIEGEKDDLDLHEIPGFQQDIRHRVLIMLTSPDADEVVKSFKIAATLGRGWDWHEIVKIAHLYCKKYGNPEKAGLIADMWSKMFTGR